MKQPHAFDLIFKHNFVGHNNVHFHKIQQFYLEWDDMMFWQQNGSHCQIKCEMSTPAVIHFNSCDCLSFNVQDSVFRLAPHIENGRGKSPYDPKLLTASMLIGEF